MAGHDCGSSNAHAAGQNNAACNSRFYGLTKWTYYDTLINKEGACSECVMTVGALADCLPFHGSVRQRPAIGIQLSAAAKTLQNAAHLPGQKCSRGLKTGDGTRGIKSKR